MRKSKKKQCRPGMKNIKQRLQSLFLYQFLNKFKTLLSHQSMYSILSNFRSNGFFEIRSTAPVMSLIDSFSVLAKMQDPVFIESRL
jgi:hypothetical protein